GPPADNVGVDEMPAAALGSQVAFLDEQFVCQRDRVARYPELLRKDARRRQRHTDRDLPVEYCRDQHFANLPLQTDLALESELDQLIPHRGLGAGHEARVTGLRLEIYN